MDVLTRIGGAICPFCGGYAVLPPGNMTWVTETKILKRHGRVIKEGEPGFGEEDVGDDVENDVEDEDEEAQKESFVAKMTFRCQPIFPAVFSISARLLPSSSSMDDPSVAKFAEFIAKFAYHSPPPHRLPVTAKPFRSPSPPPKKRSTNGVVKPRAKKQPRRGYANPSLYAHLRPLNDILDHGLDGGSTRCMKICLSVC